MSQRVTHLASLKKISACDGSSCRIGHVARFPRKESANTYQDFPNLTRYRRRERTALSEKEQKALKTVKNYMWWFMGAGLIPVPFVDLVAVSGVQLKMLAEISKIYGVQFQESRGKAVVGALIGSIVPSAMSFGAVGSLLKAVPLVGALVGTPSMVVFCGASAWALGKVFIQHFESGGTFLDFNPAEVKEHFQEQFEEGRKMAATMETEQKTEVPA
jgi:uncharacterized protein (DUF697 family)